MIDIGSTNFLIRVPSLPKLEFKEYSTTLFDTWVKEVETSLAIEDFSIFLEIEEGSIKGRGKILAAAGALYLGIGQYGDFMSGVDTIKTQVSAAGSTLIEQACSPFGGAGVATKSRKYGGTLSRLRTLFDKVQRRQLTVDQAMLEIDVLFDNEVNDTDGFLEKIREELECAPLLPEQLNWLDDAEEDFEIETLSEPKKPKKKSIPMIAIPSQRYRVEIWRESKKGEKQIKIVEL